MRRFALTRPIRWLTRRRDVSSEMQGCSCYDVRCFGHQSPCHRGATQRPELSGVLAVPGDVPPDLASMIEADFRHAAIRDATMDVLSSPWSGDG
jgi:hypothetical protein